MGCLLKQSIQTIYDITYSIVWVIEKCSLVVNPMVGFPLDIFILVYIFSFLGYGHGY